MITLAEAQQLLSSRGVNVSMSTLRRWAHAGRFGGIYGQRDKRYLMRRAQLLRGLRGEFLAVWVRFVPRPEVV